MQWTYSRGRANSKVIESISLTSWMDLAKRKGSFHFEFIEVSRAAEPDTATKVGVVVGSKFMTRGWTQCPDVD